MRNLAIATFVGFLILLVGPDFMPGLPFDDIVYAIVDVLLARYLFFKKQEKPDDAAEIDPSAKNTSV